MGLNRTARTHGTKSYYEISQYQFVLRDLMVLSRTARIQGTRVATGVQAGLPTGVQAGVQAGVPT